MTQCSPCLVKHMVSRDPVGNEIAAHKCKTLALKRIMVLQEAKNKALMAQVKGGFLGVVTEH